MNIKEITQKVKSDSFRMAALPEDLRNGALKRIAEALLENKTAIFSANSEDLSRGEENGLSSPMMKRLLFDEKKLAEAIDGIHSLIALPDPLFQTTLNRRLDDGLVLRRVTCPIGVIGVIFESRPDALIQIASLCLKSGNCAVLKGGSEALGTNKALYDIIYEAGLASGIPEGFLTLIETRADIGELLDHHESIDLIIPRGSNEFVQYIMNRSKIPVMGHADGICHIYADADADAEMALSVIRDSKTQYAAVCNAAETLLVHQKIAPVLLPALAAKLPDVELRGCEKVRAVIPCSAADETDYATEYLDYILSLKIVGSLDEAIAHINKYGSHHTDCILTENSKAAERFMLLVDSAGVYQNCSTRFADGYRYGFGAEVGVSTGKLHARGPVGLRGLVTYKYRLYGHGHIVADYAEGRKKFNFKDLD
ncbi:MAG: glutamate-5-semialdehyde dehydrogenase [Clostridiales Family XIII bacterium]|jgi:glutamate-5-semialdehyde dehydrogenase|nr:glutamate-5-semialdehyde dehydrogenase [Clostridiales Family XIII bacterium]